MSNEVLVAIISGSATIVGTAINAWMERHRPKKPRKRRKRPVGRSGDDGSAPERS